MQTALSRFWTLVTNSISYNDNHYTKFLFSQNICFIIEIWCVFLWNFSKVCLPVLRLTLMSIYKNEID